MNGNAMKHTGRGARRTSPANIAASASVGTSGFSTSTCFPARTAIAAYSAWLSGAVSTSTASTPGSPITLATSVDHRETPNRAAQSAIRPASRPAIATSSARPPCSASCGKCLRWAMSP